ncbi:MAG: hypothetical protein ABIE23_06200 [archaeon]
MNGQVSLEYLMVVGFFLVVIGVVFIYSYSSSSDTFTLDKIDNSLSAIKNGVNQVYALGPGNQIKVDIDLPYNILDHELTGRSIAFVLQRAGGTTDIVAYTDAEVVGELPITAGRHTVVIKMLESGVVRIGEGLIITPTTLIRTKVPGSSEDSNIFTLSNRSTENLTNLIGAISGSIASYVAFDDSSTIKLITNGLTVNQDLNFDVNFAAIPAGTAAGFYEGFVDVNSNEGFTDRALIQLRIPGVIQDINIAVFNDSNYLVYDEDFAQGETVYYLIKAIGQTGEEIEIIDLNITISDPPPVTNDSNYFNQSVPIGGYKGEFYIDCGAEEGEWTITAQANDFNYVREDKNFNVAEGGLDANSFWFSCVDPDCDKTGTTFDGWRIGNSCLDNITITEIKTKATAGADVKGVNRITINNITKYNGSETTDWVVLSGGFTVAGFTNYLTGNSFKFGSSIEGTQEFDLYFKFEDASIYHTTFTK